MRNSFDYLIMAFLSSVTFKLQEKKKKKTVLRGKYMARKVYIIYLEITILLINLVLFLHFFLLFKLRINTLDDKPLFHNKA